MFSDSATDGAQVEAACVPASGGPEWYSICYSGDRTRVLKTQKKEREVGRSRE